MKVLSKRQILMLHSMLVFLDINNITLSYEDDDLIAAILRVASGDMDDSDLLEWLKAHIE